VLIAGNTFKGLYSQEKGALLYVLITGDNSVILYANNRAEGIFSFDDAAIFYTSNQLTNSPSSNGP
jgi:hypothetical protein